MRTNVSLTSRRRPVASDVIVIDTGAAAKALANSESSRLRSGRREDWITRGADETARWEAEGAPAHEAGPVGPAPVTGYCGCVTGFAAAGFFGIQNAGSCARVSFGT